MILNIVINNKRPLLLLAGVFAFTALILFANASLAFSREQGWQGVVEDIEKKLDSSIESYRRGDVAVARALIMDSYFEGFEGEGMERAISVYISEERKAELESLFRRVLSDVSEKKPLPSVIVAKQRLLSELRKDAVKLSSRQEGGKPYQLFFNSFVIILREGFEAILVIGAIIAYLKNSGNIRKTPAVYKGVAFALIASVITAFFFHSVIVLGGKSMEAIEGITMLLATAVLFYVSFWLISKVEVKRWHDYIRRKVSGSVTRSSAFALGFAAFLAVYREGAETVLFYQALYLGSEGNPYPMAAGFLAGSLVLAGTFAFIRYLSVKVPAGPFFLVTSIILYYLSFTFAGKGILELQEAQWIPSTRMDGFPEIGFAGIYGTREGVIVQSALIILFMVSIFYILARRERRVEA